MAADAIRNHLAWTQQELDDLAAWRAEGVPCRVIAERLGRRLSGVYGCIERRKHAAAPLPAYVCSGCHQLRARGQFTESMRRPGGLCVICKPRKEPTVSPVDAAGHWLLRWLQDHDGAVSKADAIAAGADAGHIPYALGAAVSRWPTMVSIQRWAGEPHSRRTVGWWLLTDRLEDVRAADLEAQHQRKHPRGRINHWTQHDDQVLADMRAAGHTARQIGEVLGRTAHAVGCHVSELRARNQANGRGLENSD